VEVLEFVAGLEFVELASACVEWVEEGWRYVAPSSKLGCRRWPILLRESGCLYFLPCLAQGFKARDPVFD